MKWKAWMKWLAVGMDVVLGLYIVAVLALIFFLPTFHDCTCFGGPTPLERFGNAVEDVVTCVPLERPCLLLFANVFAAPLVADSRGACVVACRALCVVSLRL